MSRILKEIDEPFLRHLEHVQFMKTAQCCASGIFWCPVLQSSSSKQNFQTCRMQKVLNLPLIRGVLCRSTTQCRRIHLTRMSSNLVRALIMGPPGSGKGTVSERIVNTFSVTHLSSGDVLRSQIKEGTEVGLKAKEIVEKGELVPDEIMIELILNKMKELGEGSWLLDGELERTKVVLHCSHVKIRAHIYPYFSSSAVFLHIVEKQDLNS